MVENGLIERWRKIYYPRDMCSVATAISELPDPATVQDTQGGFALLLGGVIVGLALLILEVAVYRYTRSQENCNQMSAARQSMPANMWNSPDHHADGRRRESQDIANGSGIWHRPLSRQNSVVNGAVSNGTAGNYDVTPRSSSLTIW